MYTRKELAELYDITETAVGQSYSWLYTKDYDENGNEIFIPKATKVDVLRTDTPLQALMIFINNELYVPERMLTDLHRVIAVVDARIIAAYIMRVKMFNTSVNPMGVMQIAVRLKRSSANITQYLKRYNNYYKTRPGFRKRADAVISQFDKFMCHDL